MNFKTGDLISLRHYSGKNPFRSIVLSENDDVVEVKLTIDFAVFNLFPGDPVVLSYQTGDKVYNASCSLMDVITKTGSAKIKIHNLELTNDKRAMTRYPVSLYADVRPKDSSKKSSATIRNISSDGMLICSKASFNIEHELEIDMYMDKTLTFLKGEVIWKIHGSDVYEYGLKALYPSLQARNAVRRFLQELKEEQDAFIMELNQK